MDLRTLIPDLEQVAAPVMAVVGGDGTGLSGLASQLESQDLEGMAAAVGERLLGELTNRLPAEGGGPFAGATGALQQFSASATVAPADLLEGVTGPLAELEGVIERVPELLGSLREVADAIEAARSGDLGPVVAVVGDALAAVAQRAAGTDLTAFEQWTSYLADLAEQLAPIIDAGGTQDEIRDRLIEFAVARIVEAIEGVAPAVGGLLGDLEATVEDLLPDVPGLGIPALRDDVLAELQAVRAAAETAGGDVATAVEDYRTRIRGLSDALLGALAGVEGNLAHPLLTPGGAFAAAEEEIDRSLAMQVQDFTDVEGRLEEVFTSIEEAVDAVDMTAVTGPITGFFTTVGDAISTVNADAVRAELDAIFARVDELVDRFESLLTGLTARIQEWLGEVAAAITSLLDSLGTVGPDGTFQFGFQAELDGLYDRIDAFIQGDPGNPAAFSLRGALGDLRGALEQLIATLEGGLTSLAAQLAQARDQLGASLSGVQAELEAVNPRDVMEQAKAALESAFEQIGGLEFDSVVDPIVAELEKIRDDLAAIDTSELNDLLRAALKTALDAITTSNFDREITRPLLEEFDELLEQPKAALQGFAGRVNELLQRVAAISPSSLLQPVQAEIDRLLSALDLDVKALIEPPLQRALRQLKRELERLDPGAFLEPLVEGFAQVRSVIDGVEPERLLEPAQAAIDRVAARIRGVDLSALVAPVNAVFGDVDRFLEQVSPAQLVRPLSEPFQLIGRTLDRFRPSVLLAPLVEIMDRIGGFTVDVPDAVVTTIRTLYDQALARADALDPTLVLGDVSTAVTGLRRRVDSLQIEGVVHALQQEFDRVRVAVAAADARDGTSVTPTFDALLPTLALASVVGRAQRVQNRLGAVLASLDPAPLRERFQQARARLAEFLPTALRDDITPGRLRALISLIDPTTWIDRLDEIYQRILGKVAALDPAALVAPLQGAWENLRDTLRAIDVGALTGRVEQVFDRIADAVGSLSLAAVVAPLTRTIAPLKAAIRALDPARIADALRERYRNLLELLEDVAVDEVVDALQESWDRLADRIQELFDLDTILEPLTAIMEQIGEILGGLDMGEIVGVLEEKLDKIRDELEEALNRVGDAFKEMLAAVPLDGGGASASASI